LLLKSARAEQHRRGDRGLVGGIAAPGTGIEHDHLMGRAADCVTLVVAPTNVFGLKIIDRIHDWQLQRRKVFSTDVGDAWNVHDEALAQLLTRLFQQRQRILVLSGDIHYSSVVRLSYQDKQTQSVLVQLTASAFKNEETLTRLLHTRLKGWLLPEPVRRWVGWSEPPDMIELPTAESHPQPDWRCVLEWIPRQRYQNLVAADDFYPRRSPAKLRAWLQPLRFWQNRWFQSGREVVGLNNMALVEFDTASVPPTVTQQNYWFTLNQPAAIAVSRFTSDIAPNAALLRQLKKDRPGGLRSL
ncbi:MAG: hypothetical protein F6K04_21625, partial [Leptolyngbya sp. SIO4C5]|nr:hypothetical protein [Leptolyngbya sp. SIO4C5]